MARMHILLGAFLLVIPALPMGGAAVEQATYIELVGETPSWWSPEVRAAADAASAEGKLLNPLTGETVEPKRTSVAVPDLPVAPDYLFIRPGALFLGGDNGALCTYNFIYTSGTQIGVAGHCVTRVGEPVYILSTPPTVPLISRLGTVDSFRNGGPGDDWALIDIDAAWYPYVDPNMAYLGGPSCAAWTSGIGPIKHVGHGIQTGVVAAVPRVGYASQSDGELFRGYTEVSGGDSGSAIISITGATCAMGAAAGILTHCSSLTGLECLPLFAATDIRSVPATVTTGFDPL